MRKQTEDKKIEKLIQYSASDKQNEKKKKDSTGERKTRDTRVWPGWRQGIVN